MTERQVNDDQLPKGAGTAGEVPPIPAASVILLRGNPFEVLMMRRNESSSFVPGAWVFPGGTLEQTDRSGGDDEAAIRRCALRELFEETGIWLGIPFDGAGDVRQALLGGEAVDLDAHTGGAFDELVFTSRWVTPVGVPKRFDTWFFLAEVADGVEGTPDESEGLDLEWLTPDEALRRHREGSFPMVFPTIRNLEELASFRSTRELVEARRGAKIEIILPVLVIENGRKTIIIPGER